MVTGESSIVKCSYNALTKGPPNSNGIILLQGWLAAMSLSFVGSD